MPIVELDIGGTPRKFQVSDGYTPEDLDHIVQSLNAPIGPAATTDTPTSGVMGAVSQGTRYVGRKALEWQKAADTMLGGLQSTAPPDNPPTDPWDIAGQTATALGPAVAGIPATAAGLGAGAVTRAVGGDEQTADLANAGAQLVTGGVQAARATGGLNAANTARWTGIADRMAARGTQMAGQTPVGDELFWNLARARGRFNTGGVEGRTANAVMRALARGDRLTYGDLDNALTAVTQVAHDSPIAGYIRGARDALTAGTDDAAVLNRAYRASRLARTRLPAAVRAAVGTGGMGTAAIEAYRGNYGRAAGALALGATGAGMSVGHALAAAGPMSRAAVGAAGTLAPDAGGGGGGDETQPADIGTAAPAAPETPPPSPASPSARIQPLPGPYGREIAAVAHLAGVPGTLIQSHMKVESGGNADAIGDQGRSIGLMQIQPGTATVVAPQAAKLLGRTPDLKNPFDNLLVGGLLLRRYLDQTDGDVGATAQKYNGGENTSGNPMTRQYAGKIIENFRGGG